MKGGTLNNEQRSQEYYRIALKCHELSNQKKGCDHQCAKCTLNILLYVDDVRDATLIKTSAGIDWQRGQVVKARESGENIAHFIMFLLGVALFIIVGVWPVTCVVKSVKQWVKPTGPEQESSSYYSTYATPEVERKVLDTLRIMYSTAIVDKDKNGKYNCIDYAVTFYELYGPEARLIWVVLISGKLTHLYCIVPNGYGGWLHIETYAYSTTLTKSLISVAYGKEFKSYAYKDVTTDYQKIISGNYYWRWL